VVANAADLVASGIEASVQADRVRLRRIDGRDFPRHAILQLELTGHGRTRRFELRLMPDLDADGVDDLTECLAGDLDEDGVPDGRQASVAALPAPAELPGSAQGAPVRDPVPADPGSFLGLRAMDAGSGAAGLPGAVRITGARLEVLSSGAVQAWSEAMDPVGDARLSAQAGMLWYALQPGDDRREFAHPQQIVRVLLPPGSGINACVKFDARGQAREFVKEPLRDAMGRLRTDASGRTLFTGAEFRPATGGSGSGEIWIHLVDNERGDEDPTVGRILDPVLLAVLDRSGTLEIPRIDPPSSPQPPGTFWLGGSAMPGGRVRLWESGLLQAEVSVDAQGRWRWQPIDPPSDGVHGFTASAREASGAASTLSNEVWVRIGGDGRTGSPDPSPRTGGPLRWVPGGGGLQVGFQATPGRRFRVLFAASPRPAEGWHEAGRIDADAAGRVFWIDPEPPDAGRFYRIEPVP
jgi:hypothetical protein